MRKDTRDRLLLPLLLPLGLLAAMVLIMVLFSRILLNTTPDAATAVALVVAVTILVGGGVVASRGRAAGAAGLGSLLGVVAGVAMLAGGIALALAKPAAEGGGEGAVRAFAAEVAAPPGASTKGFDPTTLSFPAGEPVALTFDNRDPGVPHNVAITEGDINKDPQTSVLFAPSGTITGSARTVYRVEPLQAGTYHFHCEVHPTTMTGTIDVAAGQEGGGGTAGGGGEGPPAGAPITIAAKGLQFDTDQLDLSADAPTKLTFDNQDAGIPHNVAIYRDDTLADNLFSFEPFPGPAERSFDVPPLPEGEYFFHCDVHPTMSGTVVVAGGGGGPPGGGAEGGGSEGGGAQGAGAGTEGAGAGTEAAGAGGQPTAGGAPGSVAVVAENLQFDAPTLELDAGSPTSLSFDNRDAGTPHNLSIYAQDPASDPSAEQLFTFEPFPGPAKREFTIPGLQAGTYAFQCDVHPTMNGDVSVR